MNPTSKPIADSKLVTFVVGQQKKSRFQKAREEKELKQKLDDEETAKVYDSFVSSFTEEEDGKTFVRGGLAGHRDNSDAIYGGSKGELYRLEKSRGGSEMDKIMHEMKDRDTERTAKHTGTTSGTGDAAPRSGSSSNKGKRQIDDFLNEIMNRQEAQGSDRGRGDSDSIYGRDRDREGPGGNVMSTSLSGGYIEKGSFDNGDPTTTNLYLGSLSPATTEEDLLDLFGKYGDINSVKIMWPRSEEEKARKRNCGFVSFKRRADAEDALIELQDYDLDGFKMVLGWGKAVKISSAPFTLTRSSHSAAVPAPAPVPTLVSQHAAPVEMLPPPHVQHHAPMGMFPPSSMLGNPAQGQMHPGHPGSMSAGHMQGFAPPQYPPGYSLPPPPMRSAGPATGPPPFCPMQPPAHPFGAPPPATVPQMMAPSMNQPPHLALNAYPAEAPQMRHPPPGQHFHPPPGMSPAGYPPQAIQPPSALPTMPALPPRLNFPPPGVAPAGGGFLSPPPHVTISAAPQSTPHPGHVALQQEPFAAKVSQPVITTPVPAAAEDLATMSVDSFLDSIIASAKPAPASETTAFAPEPAPQVPVFRPPPAPAPTMLPAAPMTGTLSANMPAVKAHIIVTIPEDQKQRALIDLVAKYVATDGEAFEKNIKAKEEGNMMYSFLFESDTPEAHYYRWRTYVNVWGDSGKRWSETPLQWSLEGQVLAPPRCPHRDSSPDGAGGEEVRHHSHKKRSRSRSHSADRHSHKHRRSRSASPGRINNRPGSGSFSSSAAHNGAHSGDRNRDTRTRDHRRSASRSRSRSRGREDRDHSRRDHHRDQYDRDRTYDRDRDRDRRDNRRRDSSRDRDRDGHRDSGRDHRSQRDRERDRQEAEKADRSRYAGMTGAQIEREKAKKRLEHLAKLSREDYQDWKGKLQGLNLSRESIKQAMGFAYDKIESAEEIIVMLKDRLILPSSYAAVKVAGLYLLSDILHNAGAPIKHASTYRSQVQAALPEVIENLSRLFHNTSGRMSAFNIEDRVKKMFAVWAEWSVFPALYLIGLQAMFHFSEADTLAMRAYVNAQLEQEQIDGVSIISDGANSSTSELNALRKKAKMCGVAHTDSTTKYELQYKLEYVDKFAQSRYGSSAVASISTLLLPTAYSDCEDIDGMPLDSGESSAGEVKLTPLEMMLNSEQAVAVDYDDDIDGVPLTMDEYSIPVSSQPPPTL